MKKFFTLVAVALMATGVNAQTTKVWNMADWESVDVTAEGTDDGLTYYGESKSAFSTGNATITKGEEEFKFTGRIKLGGGSTFKTGSFSRVFAFDAKKGDVVTVFATHGSSSGDPRKVLLSQEPSDTNRDEGTAFASKSLEPSEKNYVEGTVPADGKVYVWCDNNNGVYAIYCTSAGGTDGISNVRSEKADGAAYNLAGQKVADGFKGLVIKNGKKIIVK